MTAHLGRNHLRIGELPDLRIVSLSDLVFHEDPDEERLLNLVNRLGAEAALKNPPIVTDPGQGRKLIILDGANRVTALIKLGYKHIPVQVVALDDPLLNVRCWHHAVEKLDRGYFRENLAKISGIRISDGFPESIDLGENGEESDEDDPEAVKYNGYLCSLTSDDDTTISIYNSGHLLDQVQRLCEITNLYLHTPYSDRVSYTKLASLKHNYPEFRTLVTFRPFDKHEVLEVVLSGRKLPAGITRVLLPKRALGLNIRLELLKSALTLEEKNHWLTEMIHRLVANKSIRFYQEPTFVFDE